MFLCESEASATDVFCAKANSLEQKSPLFKAPQHSQRFSCPFCISTLRGVSVITDTPIIYG